MYKDQVICEAIKQQKSQNGILTLERKKRQGKAAT